MKNWDSHPKVCDLRAYSSQPIIVIHTSRTHTSVFANFVFSLKLTEDKFRESDFYFGDCDELKATVGKDQRIRLCKGAEIFVNRLCSCKNREGKNNEDKEVEKAKKKKKLTKGTRTIGQGQGAGNCCFFALLESPSSFYQAIKKKKCHERVAFFKGIVIKPASIHLYK